MNFSDFITEALNYKNIVDDFDEILSSKIDPKVSNRVIVTGKLKGKKITKEYLYKNPEVAAEVSKKTSYFIGVK